MLGAQFKSSRISQSLPAQVFAHSSLPNTTDRKTARPLACAGNTFSQSGPGFNGFPGSVAPRQSLDRCRGASPFEIDDSRSPIGNECGSATIELIAGVAAWIFGALFIMALVLCAGCAPYQSRIKFGNTTLVLPKDAKFDSLQVSHTISTNATNITVTISNATFKMNPQVIDAKTRHDVELFKAGKEAAVELLEKAP